MELKREQRHTAELAALQETATQELNAAAEAGAAWQRRCCTAEAALGRAQEQLQGAQREAAGLRGAVRELQRQVQKGQEAVQRREADSQVCFCGRFFW